MKRMKLEIYKSDVVNYFRGETGVKIMIESIFWKLYFCANFTNREEQKGRN